MAPNERTRKCFLLEVLCFVVFLKISYGQQALQKVYGYSGINADEFGVSETGDLFFYRNQEVSIRLFGHELALGERVSFTSRNAERLDNCNDFEKTDAFKISSIDQGNSTSSISSTSAIVTANLDVLEEKMSVCFKSQDTDDWIYQGNDAWLKFTFRNKAVKTTLLPLWLQIIVIIVLLVFSGLFSGLNLGLMSLDQTELKILTNCGSKREMKYAKRIAPLRKRGNFLLCTILLGNVLVNNTLTILLDDLTGSGYAAILGATAGIVIFGEIIPQAVCSRYGLAIGANTIWFTKFFMLVTFPLSFPISKCLDWALGEEICAVYNRDRLRELLMLTQEKTDLINDEVNIIKGALELRTTTVGKIMTHMDDVYLININSILDFDTLNDIIKTGYTRVPVYEGAKTNIVSILNIKDLAFIDPDDNTPLKTVCEFYKHQIKYVFEDVKLSDALQEFKEGKSHMNFVQRIQNEGPGDPYYETVGVVTLEDVIEEIIQTEIVDETDTITDNRRRVHRPNQTKDFSIFNTPDALQAQNYPKVAPQLALATFQYLNTTVPAFTPEYVSEAVLQRLIKQNVVLDLHVKDRNAPETILYQRDRKCDHFILILQGRVEVHIGKENLSFEGGPFTYFGCQALTGGAFQSINQSLTSLNSTSTELLPQKQPYYVPDFTVRATSDYIQYLKIRRSYYDAARRATALERKKKSDNVDHFTKEWMKVAAGNQDNISIRTDAESVTMTPDKDGNPTIPASPVSVVIDTGSSDGGQSTELRQRSSTRDTQSSSTGTEDCEAPNVDTPLMDNEPTVTVNAQAAC